MFDIKNLTAFGLIAGFAAFWSQIKIYISKFFSIFIRTDSVEQYSVAKFFIQDLIKECKVFRWGSRRYITGYGYLKKHDFWGNYLFLETKGFIAFYKGYIPIIVSESSRGVKVTYFFRTLPYTTFLQRAYERYVVVDKKANDEIEEDNFYVTHVFGGKESSPSYSSPSLSSPAGNTSSGSSPEHHSPSSSGLFEDIRTLGDKNEIIGMDYAEVGEPKSRAKIEYYWSEKGLEFLDAVRFWKEEEQWYKDRHIPWRRGCLLSGIHGGGKSRLVLETAKLLQIPLYKMNISNMDDNEFVSKFEAAPYSAIVLIDDCDVIFHGRENILAGKCLNKQLLSFDTLINTLSGVKQKNGVFVVMATNHPELLDEALTRPGRLDERIELGELDEAGRRFIAENILCDWPELMESTVAESAGQTASDFENHCVKIAIAKKYENKNRLSN